MTQVAGGAGLPLEQLIKQETRRLGFVLAGVTTPDPPAHIPVFEEWISQGRHGTMAYLSSPRSRSRRADPRQIMPECRSIIVLGAPYWNPAWIPRPLGSDGDGNPRGRVAAYAWGRDYHDVLPKRLHALVAYIEQQIGRRAVNRCYTDTAPVLERDLAQRCGLGWIGKNTCLIHPKLGSYFLLAELLLDVDLAPDTAFQTDHCGTCTRCIDACPTDCILPDRTIDSRRCISYLTIEARGGIPIELRPQMENWVFGCDVCQMVCPWNRFAPAEGDEAFAPRGDAPTPVLKEHLQLSSEHFKAEFQGTPLKRPKFEGYLRNLTVAAGNTAGPEAIPILRGLAANNSAFVQEHAAWAIKGIEQRSRSSE